MNEKRCYVSFSIFVLKRYFNPISFEDFFWSGEKNSQHNIHWLHPKKWNAFVTHFTIQKKIRAKHWGVHMRFVRSEIKRKLTFSFGSGTETQLQNLIVLMSGGNWTLNGHCNGSATLQAKCNLTDLVATS